MSLPEQLALLAARPAPSKPRILDLSDEADRGELSAMLESGDIKHVVDDYEEELRELFQIENPTFVYDPSFEERFAAWRDETITAAGSRERLGRWAYYPWSDTLVHILAFEDFERTRTARNRNLITEEEQKRFYGAVVGVGGLSVGNSVALALVLMGGVRRLRLADFDRLAISNLNRIRADVAALGLPKVEMTARQIYALDPYAEVELFPDGLTEENIGRFFDGLDVVVDELDTLAIKLRLREEAKKRRIPVVMGADNGDNAIIDIERHDLEADAPFFHGALGKVTVADLSGLDKFGIGRTITKMLGAENITPRMQASLLEMGKTIVSWPQLGGAALLNGIGAAYCVRKIVTGQSLESERALLSLDDALDPAWRTEEARVERAESSKKFADLFGL